MNTQILSTLQVFQSFSHKCKSLVLQFGPKEFIRLLCKCIVNLLKGYLQCIKGHHVTKLQNEIWFCSLKEIPASVYNYNNSLSTQTITKQEFPKYQTEQNPMYQIDSLKREMNNKLFDKADSLVDKKLFCPCFSLWNSKTLILDVAEIGI